MSKGLQIFLGLAFAPAALIFAYVGATLGKELPNGPMPIYAMAAFCTVVAIACLIQTGRAITLRVIGAVICVVCTWYIFASLGTDNLFRAIAAGLVFGVPFAYLAVTGRYPNWGHGGAAVQEDSSEK